MVFSEFETPAASIYEDGFLGDVDISGVVDPEPTGLTPVDLRSPDYLRELSDKLSEKGYAVFDGIRSKQDLLMLAWQFGVVIKHRDSDEDGVTTIARRDGAEDQEGFEGFTDHELQFHTDGTAVANPANFLLIYCEKQAESGGQSRLVDGRKLYLLLKDHSRLFLELLQTNGTASFGRPGESWDGSVFSKEGGLISIRYRDDRLGRYDSRILENHSKLINLMTSVQDVFTAREGQGYIINNRRSVHARSPFEGDRVMHRVLVQSDFSRLDPRLEPGFRE